MCDFGIFTGLAAATIAAVSSASTAPIIGAAIGGLAAGGISAAIANKSSDSRSSRSVDTSALNRTASLSADASNKTATKLQENTAEKRTISSLRIPLKQTGNTSNSGVNTTDTKVGLNIPM